MTPAEIEATVTASRLLGPRARIRVLDEQGIFRKPRPPRPPPPRAFSLVHPEILRTCQLLYLEGLPLLFQENTLLIVITDAVKCWLGRPFGPADSADTVPSLVIPVLPKYIEETLKTSEVVPLPIQTLLQRFRKFSIEVNILSHRWSEDHFVRVNKKLASCVHESSRIMIRVGYIHHFWKTGTRLNDLLNPFKLLRGSHFELLFSDKDLKIPRQLVQSLYEEVTSNTPAP